MSPIEAFYRGLWSSVPRHLKSTIPRLTSATRSLPGLCGTSPACFLSNKGGTPLNGDYQSDVLVEDWFGSATAIRAQRGLARGILRESIDSG